jgi:hypothetical protein
MQERRFKVRAPQHGSEGVNVYMYVRMYYMYVSSVCMYVYTYVCTYVFLYMYIQTIME